MQKQLAEIDKKLNRLEESFIEEEITKEICLKYTEKAKEERREIERQIARPKWVFEPGKCSRMCP
jgi:hypothetical protein